jgi:hypothetical protein
MIIIMKILKMDGTIKLWHGSWNIFLFTEIWKNIRKGGEGNQLSNFSVGQCQKIFQINKG